ncbi:MAG: phosphoribosylformylglycinamidine synthase [Varibaculum cambriense]|uniref:phosphoribosylformylglycinamidine synthase n=2 Tax=Varibaculum cambriense TaxID=184870 RepID=UPI0029046669|nr:phosphoribosylformylglycinamidine synthase [Varibaculum cambriense]MDU2150651.1 phosphoribosylformylglycinamidine synthase [Varibaculum cambriense]
MNKRIFVRKKNDTTQFNVYDIFGLDVAALEKAKYTVFAEVNQDLVLDEIDIEDYYVLEYLPGQFDQRADAAEKCLQLQGYEATVKCGYGHTGKVEFNPIEMRLKDMSVLENETYVPNRQLPPSIEITEDYYENAALAMTKADLLFIKGYFDSIGRLPTETEIKVIDTYWSDHCRHTTFETELTDAAFSGPYADRLQEEWDRYLEERNSEKPITLMDLATLAAKREKVKNQEVSNEINACSVYVTVGGERYILQFKNETHNHPTEIEPFGGASTCIGGAIRDPLSGRTFVYQAMRISGSADPRIADPIEGKLSSKEITQRAAAGYSSYGNQIGLATNYVKEIYHPGYRAKRLELGFVVGAAPAENIIREEPAPGDLILLIGGRTGRDGIGGATGSSKTHTRDSSQTCGAEVQKGNPIIERKIQRLFRRGEVAKRIKKCNDFGAGGVSVAIGELAPGLEIELDRVPVKYQGLNGTELAISESQERMAVCIDPTDLQFFYDACASEDVEVTHVATVTAERRLVMHYLGETIVDISRDFLDTNGVRSQAKFKAASSGEISTRRSVSGANLQEKLQNNLADLNICSQRGLNEIFDSSIGATTLTLPYGGKFQRTPSQVSAQLVSLEDGQAEVASVAAYGFEPSLAELSPYHSAIVSVVQSMSRLAAAGVDYHDLYFTFQEYFQRLSEDPEKWGTVVEALLGANRVLRHFHLASIGGKDSMSGTFEDMHVPPTLVSFAIGMQEADKLRTPEFKARNHRLYLLPVQTDELGAVDLESFQAALDKLQAINPLSAYALGYGGIAEALPKMAFGNRIGFSIDTEEDLFASRYGSFLLETDQHLDLPLLGYTGSWSDSSINGQRLDLAALQKAWEQPLADIFPTAGSQLPNDISRSSETCLTKPRHAPYRKQNPQVFIPIFPGTNCEYDMARAFAREGAQVVTEVYRDAASYARQIEQADILALPGGFSVGDEPDGSAKFIVSVLRQEQVKEAVHSLLRKGGLILGICNGFQALIKSGLLPYGQIRDLDPDSPTLATNDSGHHVAKIVHTAIASVASPWLSSFDVGEVHHIPISHGEGRVVMSPEQYRECSASGQIATKYLGENPNGSSFGIEGLFAHQGQILGKMGHSERSGSGLYLNYCPEIEQNLFRNGVNYFRWM